MKILNILTCFTLGLISSIAQADQKDPAYYLDGNAYKINKVISSYMSGNHTFMVLELMNLVNGEISYQTVEVGSNQPRAAKKLKKKVQRKPADPGN